MYIYIVIELHHDFLPLAMYTIHGVYKCVYIYRYVHYIWYIYSINKYISVYTCIGMIWYDIWYMYIYVICIYI